MRLSPHRRNLLAASILFAAIAACYVPVLNGQFLWDDLLLITGSEQVRSVTGLKDIWLGRTADYLPLTSTVWWVQWQMWGEQPISFHVVNIALHAAACVLLWRLLNRLKAPGAWTAALLFGIHPVAVASVAWISETKNTLSLVFYLAACLAYLRFSAGRSVKAYMAAVFLFLAALLSKSSTVMLPVVLLGYEIYASRWTWRKVLIRLAPFFTLSLVFGLIAVWFQFTRAIGDVPSDESDLWIRLARVGYVVWFYVYKAVLPIDLSMIYPRWNIEASLTSFLPDALLVLFTGALYRVRSRVPELWWGWLYFVCNLLPVLGLISMAFARYSFVSDHLQYLALPGLISGVVGALARYVALPRARTAGIGLAALLSFTFAWLTWQRAGIFSSSESLWANTITKNPAAWAAHHNLGVALSHRGEHESALGHFLTAVELAPRNGRSRVSAAIELIHLHDATRATQLLQQAIKLEPSNRQARLNLGLILSKQHQPEAAAFQFRALLEANPNDPAANFYLGSALLGGGNARAAIPAFRRALALNSNDPIQQAAIRWQLSQALSTVGHMEESLTEQFAAVELRPDWVEALNNIAWQLATTSNEKLRNPRKALELAERANEAEAASNPIVLDTLAAALAANRRFKDAEQVASQAIQVAELNGQYNLAHKIRVRLAQYRGKQPIREELPRTAVGDGVSANSSPHTLPPTAGATESSQQ